MRKLIPVVLAIILSGCVSDVSNKSPHNRLIGTTWKLKTDAYIIKYKRNDWGNIVVPCVENCEVYIPKMDSTYDEKRIGQVDNEKMIVGGFKQGDSFKIISVKKHYNIEMGNTFWPIAIPIEENQWIGHSEFNARVLYRHFYNKLILNPEYAEQVDK